MNFLDNFRLNIDKEDCQTVIDNIDKGVVFKGTNLWILVFAIFIASLGLNVNSTAVIIGAMLVSPLMGPILGLGLGMAINDLALLRKSLFNYLFAAAVGLATSTIYFLLSPINEAHSEILARISPNVYDVLIALFGGLAGMLAVSSKLKGNVIPGVAIATALMPPLCTAGYGLATFQFTFFFGALYLFVINTVFIALATLITTQLLNYPVKHLLDKKKEVRAQRLIWVIVLITFLPSIYFAYDMVQRNKFVKRVNGFVDNEAVFKNDYLLSKKIDAEKCEIVLVYGGKKIEEKEIEELRSKLKNYELGKAVLIVNQGFAYSGDNVLNQQLKEVGKALQGNEAEIEVLRNELDSLKSKVASDTLKRLEKNPVKKKKRSMVKSQD